MKIIHAILACGLMAGPAFAGGHATGDAAAGEAVFNKCQACHVVADAEGNVLAGRSGKTGPNLYGLSGRTVGSVEDFRYGDDIKAVGESGLVWSEEEFVAFVQDPKGWLGEKLDSTKARSKMTFMLRGGSAEEDARNLWAYIASLSPEN